MTGETIFIFIMSIILLCIKPGPGQALRVTTALRDGFWPAMMISIGVTVICNLYLVLAAVGSTIISGFFNEAGFFFRVLGGAYLVYLAYRGFKSAQKKNETKAVEKKSYIQYFVMGLVMSLSNPIDIFFFVGILPGLIDISQLTFQNIVSFMIIMTITRVIVDVIILTLTVQSKQAIISGGHGNTVAIIANTGILLIGVFLLYTALFTSEFSYSLL